MNTNSYKPPTDRKKSALTTKNQSLQNAYFKMDHRLSYHLMQNPHISDELLDKCVQHHYTCKDAGVFYCANFGKDSLPAHIIRMIYLNPKESFTQTQELLKFLNTPIDIIEKAINHGFEFYAYSRLSKNPSITTEQLLTMWKKVKKREEFSLRLSDALINGIINHVNFPAELKMQYLLEM